MSVTHENQALLIAVREDCGQIIAFIGDAAKEELWQSGWELDDHEIDTEDAKMPTAGLYVWEGSIEYDKASDGELEITWSGQFRPARLSDLARFGMAGFEPEPEQIPPFATRMMNTDPAWLLRMADKEANGIVSVGGLVARIEQEEREAMPPPQTPNDWRQFVE